jgi:hypothetical protein
MTGSPATSDDSGSREWSVSNRTLVVSADTKRVLAILKGRDPLLLPPGSVLQFGDPLGELVVTRVRVMVGEGGGIVCAESEPMPKPHYRASAAPSDPAERPGRLHAVPSRPPRWRQVRPGNG